MYIFLKGKVKVKVDPVTAEVGEFAEECRLLWWKKTLSILHGQFDGLPVGGEETYSQLYTCIYIYTMGCSSLPASTLRICRMPRLTTKFPRPATLPAPKANPLPPKAMFFGNALSTSAIMEFPSLQNVERNTPRLRLCGTLAVIHIYMGDCRRSGPYERNSEITFLWLEVKISPKWRRGNLGQDKITQRFILLLCDIHRKWQVIGIMKIGHYGKNPISIIYCRVAVSNFLIFTLGPIDPIWPSDFANGLQPPANEAQLSPYDLLVWWESEKNGRTRLDSHITPCRLKINGWKDVFPIKKVRLIFGDIRSFSGGCRFQAGSVGFDP